MSSVTFQQDQSELMRLLGEMWFVFTRHRSKPGMKMFTEYALISAFYLILFSMIYIFIYYVLKNYLFNKKEFAFAQMNRTKRLEYVGRIVSVIHAIIVTLIAAYGCFYLWYSLFLTQF